MLTTTADSPNHNQHLFTVADVLPAALRLSTPQPRNYRPVFYDLGFNVEGLPPCVDQAHKAVQWWLNDILHSCRERRRWLTIFGRSGCGKTHLAVTASKTLQAHGLRSQKWNWSNLRSRLLNDDCPGLLEQITNMPYLMLDDVGAEYTASEKTSAISAALLYDILEARLNRWTLITTNLAPADMVDVRITSRLYRGLNELIDMRQAPDYCFQLKKNASLPPASPRN